jgi:hypothetical protein
MVSEHAMPALTQTTLFTFRESVRIRRIKFEKLGSDPDIAFPETLREKNPVTPSQLPRKCRVDKSKIHRKTR